MTGRLKPGQKLVEADLARDLDISRASVREVLRALEGERLIELVPHRGPSVASLGPDVVADIEQVWSMLTSDAVARFARKAEPEDIAALARSLARLETALAKARTIEAIDAINAFFWLIMQRCGNTVLLDVVVSLVSRLNFLRAQSLQHEGRRAACAREIGDILDALRATDVAAARTATARHIASTCRTASETAAASLGAAPGQVPLKSTSLPKIPLDEYLERGLAATARQSPRMPAHRSKSRS